MELLKIDTPELSGLEKSKAEQIQATFAPLVYSLKKLDEVYNAVILLSEEEPSPAVSEKARSLRLEYRRIRIEGEKARKSAKEEYLRAGKAIDGVNNILKWAVQDKEEVLSEIENAEEIRERERLKELQAHREELLSPYIDETDPPRDLAGMPSDVWEAFYSAKMSDFKTLQIAKEQAEKERLAAEEAERVERARVLAENIRLQKEAKKAAEERAKAEKAAAEERAKAEKAAAEERAKAEAILQKERAEREKAEAEQRRKAEEERLKALEEIRKEREAREVLEAAEKERKEKEAAEREQELSANDEEKKASLTKNLQHLREKYAFSSEANKEKFRKVCALLVECEKIML